MADGSDLTRWNGARSLAGDILAAVAKEDHRKNTDSSEGNETPYEYEDLIDDHPNRQIPSEEALRTGVSIALCAVDAEFLDFSMGGGSDPTTRPTNGQLSMVDDRELEKDKTPDDELSVWSRAVNLIARWLVSERCRIHIGGEKRHRLNSWNEARHLASQFLQVTNDELEYQSVCNEWPQVEFPEENDIVSVIRERTSEEGERQERVDEVARWVKSLDWLTRDTRETERVAMGANNDEGIEGAIQSKVLKNSDQLTLEGEIRSDPSHAPK